MGLEISESNQRHPLNKIIYITLITSNQKAVENTTVFMHGKKRKAKHNH